jgi:hypothetical protein
MGAATLLRAGAGCLEVLTDQGPALVKLAVESRAEGDRARRAENEFRDALIAIARDSSEVALRELRRGVEDLDAFTRPNEPPAQSPSRPYRTKP